MKIRDLFEAQVLTRNEVDRLVDMIHDHLDPAEHDNVDAIMDMAGQYVEDIPGLEDPMHAEKAVSLIVNAYQSKYGF